MRRRASVKYNNAKLRNNMQNHAIICDLLQHNAIKCKSMQLYEILISLHCFACFLRARCVMMAIITRSYSPRAQRTGAHGAPSGCRRNARTCTMTSTPARRNVIIKVVVTATEAAEIKENAGAARLPLSPYLRTLGLGWTPKSTLDYQAVLELGKVNADLGRLGGF
jgi:hypothetical protein